MSSKGPVNVHLKRSLKFDELIRAAQAPQRLKGYDIGWPVESQYDKGRDKTISTSAVAKINEFGAPNSKEGIGVPNNSGIPERPFFRTANDEFHKFIKAFIRNARILGNKLGATETHMIGKTHVKLVKQSILNGNWEPNQDVTVARKMRSEQKRLDKRGRAEDADADVLKPLIETGKLYKDVSYATVR